MERQGENGFAGGRPGRGIPTVRDEGAVVRTVGDAGPYKGGMQCVCDCRGDLCVARGAVMELPGYRRREKC